MCFLTGKTAFNIMCFLTGKTTFNIMCFLTGKSIVYVTIKFVYCWLIPCHLFFSMKIM
jgi:hypothetical protein